MAGFFKKSRVPRFEILRVINFLRPHASIVLQLRAKVMFKIFNMLQALTNQSENQLPPSRGKELCLEAACCVRG